MKITIEFPNTVKGAVITYLADIGKNELMMSTFTLLSDDLYEGNSFVPKDGEQNEK